MAMAAAANGPSASVRPDEDFLLWVLSDSNLPTGGFVASAGLESYHAHGFLYQQPNASSSANAPRPNSRDHLAAATVDFLRASLSSYASSALPFVLDAHRIVTAFLDGQDGGDDSSGDADAGAHRRRRRFSTLSACLEAIVRLDEVYHSVALNHVLRRASKAQGMALLTLYTKSFAAAPLERGAASDSTSASVSPHNDASARKERAALLIDSMKKRVRQGTGRQEPPHGHLPVCWGLFAAALGLSIGSAIDMHLFLQARATLSSSIRLNTLGPYLAHGLLLYQVRGVVKDILASHDWVRVATVFVGGQDIAEKEPQHQPPLASPACTAHCDADARTRALHPGWDWDWPDDVDVDAESARSLWYQEEAQGSQCVKSPVNTWPLGEIVQARHDSLHSRLFNS